MHAGHLRRIVRLSRSHRRRQQAQQASKPAGGRSAPTCSFLILVLAACCDRHSLLGPCPLPFWKLSKPAVILHCKRAQLVGLYTAVHCSQMV